MPKNEASFFQQINKYEQINEQRIEDGSLLIINNLK